jgi:4-hydroxy-tetrahydrodipicolinate reductase
MTTKVAVVGANGRMGRLACRVVDEADGFELVARLGSTDSLAPVRDADVLIDFTVPQSSPAIVEEAISNGVSVLVGTSGWTQERIAPVATMVAANPELAAVFIPNFSVGSVLASQFSALAGRFFESIEIIEAHHEAKIDSPSGTAVRTAELIGAARRELGPVLAPHVDQRARGQQVASVPIHSLRMRGVLAKQDVLFGGTDEVLTISHEVTSHEAYAAGILLALKSMPALTGVVVGLDRLLEPEHRDS